jgi:hypothetical protein
LRYPDPYQAELRANRKAYREAHPEACAKRQVERLAYRRTYLQRTYGLTEVGYDSLFARQGGKCAICGTDQWPGKGPHIDHDHGLGRVRGILCSHCNTALGLIKDDPKIAQAMIDYLGRVA